MARPRPTQPHAETPHAGTAQPGTAQAGSAADAARPGDAARPSDATGSAAKLPCASPPANHSSAGAASTSAQTPPTSQDRATGTPSRASATDAPARPAIPQTATAGWRSRATPSKPTAMVNEPAQAEARQNMTTVMATCVAEIEPPNRGSPNRSSPDSSAVPLSRKAAPISSAPTARPIASTAANRATTRSRAKHPPKTTTTPQAMSHGCMAAGLADGSAGMADGFPCDQTAAATGPRTGPNRWSNPAGTAAANG